MTPIPSQWVNEMTGKTLTALHHGLDQALRLVETVAAVIAGAIMLCAMVLVALDAFLRYLFNAPLQLQYHLTQNYLLVALVTMALAWGYRTGGYIRISGVVDLFPVMVREVVLRIGLLLSAGYIAALAWKAGEHFWAAYRADEVQLGLIDWPVSWSWIWVPVGCVLLSARLILLALRPGHLPEVVSDHTGEAV